MNYVMYMVKIRFINRLMKVKGYLGGDEEVPIMYIHALMAIVGSVSLLLIMKFQELPISHMQHTLLVLVEKACVIVVIAYVISRLPQFGEILEGKFTFKNQIILILIFGAISIFGTYSGIDIFGAMANVRDLGPMVAGLVGGPIMGLGAGLIGGLYRLSLGGFTAVPCAIATILSGLLAGLIFLVNKRRFIGVFWAVVFSILMESIHLLLALAISKPYSQALIVVEELTVPVIVANAMGVFIFGFIISNLLREKETEHERDLFYDELERKKHELLVANKIQKSFLPDKLIKIPGFDLAALNIPAHEMGSDFYDFIPLSKDKVGIVIADVAGESFPASVLMALSRTILRGEAKNQKPSLLIRYLNNLISVDIGPEHEIFITILYGELNTKTRCFTYVNAAHNPPLLFKKQSMKVDELAWGDKSLGRLGNMNLEEQKLKFESGDILLLFTDGVIEALKDRESPGEEVLRNLLESNYELSSFDIVEEINKKFIKSETNHDDLILAVLKAD